MTQGHPTGVQHLTRARASDHERETEGHGRRAGGGPLRGTGRETGELEKARETGRRDKQTRRTTEQCAHECNERERDRRSALFVFAPRRKAMMSESAAGPARAAEEGTA